MNDRRPLDAVRSPALTRRSVEEGWMAGIPKSWFAGLPLSVARRISPRPLVSVFYHLASDARLAHVAPLYSYKTPAAFERDLRFLKQHYVLVGHDEVLAYREGRGVLPPNAAQVSFDDGFGECYEVVRPLLIQHGVPCTFFVVPNLLDNLNLMHRNAAACCLDLIWSLDDDRIEAAERTLSAEVGYELRGRGGLARWVAGLRWMQRRELELACAALGFEPQTYLRERRPYMTTEQVQRLHRDGFTIGAHTCDHPELDLLPWEEAARQVVESCRVVAALTSQPRVPFAVTFNGAMLSREKLEALRAEAGVIDLVYDTSGLRQDRAWIVNRIACDSSVGDRAGRSNLEDAIRSAHLLEPARELVRRMKRRPR